MQRLLTSFLLCAGLAAQTPSTDVSVGVFPFLVGNMDARIPEIVGNCQLHGIDTLYVSAFRATGPSTGDLWINDSAGDWNPAWGPVRPSGAGINLANLIASCHAANVRVVAVFKCFAENVQPNDTAHRQYLLDVIDYFVDAYQVNGQPVYDLDGIALDYVRYVGGSGVNAANVTNFLADVRQRIGGMSLHAYLVANRFSFDGPVYNGVFNSYAAVRGTLLSQFGQDWEQFAQLCDVLMPMAYSADGSIYNTYALHQAYVRKTAEYARQACTLAGVPDRRVVPAIKTYTGENEITTPQTIEASITGALLGGGDGYQSFRYQFLVNNPTWWTKMAQFAVPGCNWPRPQLSVVSPRLTASFDAGASSDLEQTATSLERRFDVDGDGQFDTPWQPNTGPLPILMRRPGTWRPLLQVRDADGHVATSRRRFNSGSPLTVFPGAISTTNGGTSQLLLDVGPAGAGHEYLVLATLSGTTPGFVWAPGFPVPLNVDAVTSLLISDPNGTVLANGFGTFDANGRATASFTLPPVVVSILAGSTMHWSFLARDPQLSPSCVGDSRPLLLF